VRNKKILDKSINVKSDHSCVGCGVCQAVCPAGAISLGLDKDGFYKAHVDESKCMNCGRCQEVCSKFPEKFPPPREIPKKSYVGYYRTEEIRWPSSSGGFATALAETAIENGYRVIGAELDYKTFKLEHVVIDKKENLSRIRGSKYFQSRFQDILSRINKNGKYVVIGTPCQIGALRKVITGKKEYEDVILVDLYCAGVLGRNAVDKFVDYMKEINKSGIKIMNMRDKTSSWLLWGMKVIFKDGKQYYRNKYVDPLLYVFRTRQALQDACLECDTYKNGSYADLRLRDAWGFDPKKINEDFKKGLSQVLVYTDKGEELFSKAKNKIFCREVEFLAVKDFGYPRKRNYQLLELLRTNSGLVSIVNIYKRSLSIRDKFRHKLSYFCATDFYISFFKRFEKVLLALPKPVKKFLKKLLREW